MYSEAPHAEWTRLARMLASFVHRNFPVRVGFGPAGSTLDLETGTEIQSADVVFDSALPCTLHAVLRLPIQLVVVHYAPRSRL